MLNAFREMGNPMFQDGPHSDSMEVSPLQERL